MTGSDSSTRARFRAQALGSDGVKKAARRGRRRPRPPGTTAAAAKCLALPQIWRDGVLVGEPLLFVGAHVLQEVLQFVDRLNGGAHGGEARVQPDGALLVVAE